MNRRDFLRQSAYAALLPRISWRSGQTNGGELSIPLTLVAPSGRARRELINAGVPFAPGQLRDPDRLRVADSAGREIPCAVRVLEPWRVPPGRTPPGALSIRAVQIQFEASVSKEPVRVTIRLGDPRPGGSRPIVPAAETLRDRNGLDGPRVIPLLPAGWLCASRVAGDQMPAQASGELAGYERLVERSFPGSLSFINSDVFHHWLFDRTSTYYTQYVRTGARPFFDAAFHCAHFMRLHTATKPPDAGAFTLKGADVKYVYPRAMHLHYLLTGDDRALEAGRVMARFCLDRWEPEYRPGQYAEPPLGTDPEKGRPFWSTRNEAYGLLGVLHGWEMTGDEAYWRAIARYVDALAAHQAQPPDGRPPDGSWRQNWALYDPNETKIAGGASPWMTAILLSALYHAWRVTDDERIPGMVTRWCDFLDRRGFVPDGSRVRYVVDCFGSDHVNGDDMEQHSTELACSFAMGIFFSQDDEQRARFRRRFDALFKAAAEIDANSPARCYNWAFQSSSQLVYFMNRRP
jgi:hypothetical protein